MHVSVMSRQQCRCRLFAELELGLVAAHAVQDDGELGRNRHACPRMPRVLAICMPQARRLDHLRERVSREWSAS